MRVLVLTKREGNEKRVVGACKEDDDRFAERLAEMMNLLANVIGCELHCVAPEGCGEIEVG
jgi:hypothetical protein